MNFENYLRLRPRVITTVIKSYYVGFSFALDRKINNIIVPTKKY